MLACICAELMWHGWAKWDATHLLCVHRQPNGWPLGLADRVVPHPQVGEGNVCNVHVSLVPIIGVVGEQKTKPTQHSVQVSTPRLTSCWPACGAVPGQGGTFVSVCRVRLTMDWLCRGQACRIIRTVLGLSGVGAAANAGAHARTHWVYRCLAAFAAWRVAFACCCL